MSVKLRICHTIICLFLQIYLSAQDKNENYITAPIPDSLKKDADAVCRLDEHEFEIISPGKIFERERHIYTILNSNADKYSSYNTHYNKLTTINSVNGYLYNEVGKELKHFKKKDMYDVARDGEAFVSDDRMKSGSFTYTSYPFTVEYEEEDEDADALSLRGWYPPRSDKTSLLLSRYILIAPKEYKVRYKLMNSNIKPVITEKKDKIIYTWEVRNMPVIPDEPYAISRKSYDPYVLVGPSDFEIEGYKGNMAEWKDYGRFYASLQKGRDVLPDDLKQKVHLMTDGVTDAYRKIAILYDYLQKNTHYVLIQFGIGGLQTYDAAYVAKNKYGDCKALSNFMISLLKEAGIKGNPVIIYGDENEPEFVADFPSHQFNHVICCVPLNKDTVWLECTSQHLPAGYLGVFTANRFGLFVDENGGTLVHTPAYLLNDNITISTIKADLDAEGNLRLKSEARYKALSYDPVSDLLHHYSPDQQLNYLKRVFNLPTYTVNSFRFTEDYSARLPIIRESLDISVTNYAQITGRRLFVYPNILNRSTVKLEDIRDRKLDIEFKEESREMDSIEINIPQGYQVESQPKDLQLQKKYGRYQTHSEVNSDKIIYYRLFEQYRGRFPASQYEEVQNFYNDIYRADHAQIVFVKKSN